MRLIFWLSVAIVLYIYAGYPLLLALLRQRGTKRVRKASFEPTVSIIIAAYNEYECIGRKLRNCLDLDYPRSKLQIVVSLDGPTDGTESIVRSYTRHGVEMIHSKRHRGKPTALNLGMRQATGDIVVFADARQTFERGAIRRLTENFADPEVGAVSGELMLIDRKRSEASSDIGLYWKYEKWIRAMESDVHSVIGATGAIYAIRRDLYRNLPDDILLDDLLTPMRVVFAGKRVVFEPAAKAFDNTSCCARAEFSRKVRTLAGNYQLLAQIPQLLSPESNPVFWQFCSHKIGRLAVPYLLVAIFVSNAFLIGGVYTWLFAGQCAWYLFALVGRSIASRDLSVPTIATEQQR
jgi:cellulose synthase/poly-beta-1,6-N-acetylglucosamine synthase-like glycosyltransferase